MLPNVKLPIPRNHRLAPRPAPGSLIRNCALALALLWACAVCTLVW